MTVSIHNGDCLEVLKTFSEKSVDAVVTDPPYGLSFMGKKWDYDVPSVAIWQEVFRVLKPGGHLLSFGGTRTYHRMTINIEDAGFEIRDMIAWVYGSGFPKSHDVSKAIDKKLGATRGKIIVPANQARNPKVTGSGKDKQKGGGRPCIKKALEVGFHEMDDSIPITDSAKQWQGWGTALKPAHEPICLARKPLSGTVAENVLTYNTGGLNIDGCRVGNETIKHSQDKKSFQKWKELDGRAPKVVENPEPTFHQGRWPANFIHDGSEEVTKLTGDAARFFYCAKASTSDRDEGLDGFELKKMDDGRKDGKPGGDNPRNRGVHVRKNNHPTVKPTDLMRYLCRLITPPQGVVLDPFMGSGSTGKACVLEGFNFIGIEKEKEYCDIARARIDNIKTDPQFSLGGVA